MTTVEYDLKEIFAKLESSLSKLETKIDSLETKLETRIASLETKLETRIASLETKIDNQIASLETKIDNQTTEINAIKLDVAKLNEKITGYGERLQNQEFINRSILIGLIATVLGGVLTGLFMFLRTKI